MQLSRPNWVLSRYNSSAGFGRWASQRVSVTESNNASVSDEGKVMPYPPELSAAEARRDHSLPYLFDAAAQPTLEEACRHCSNKMVVPEKNNGKGITDTSPMVCCGVCQYEGRHCSQMAPAGAMQAHLEEYKRDFGFDFDAFTPEELWSRIRGRTLWLMGDSQTWHYYYSFECFLRRYAVDLMRRGVSHDISAVRELTPVTWPVYTKPMCLHLQFATRVCVVRADVADHMTQHVLPKLIEVEPESFTKDIMLVNFGLHFPNNMAKYTSHINMLREFYKQHKKQLPTMIWLATPVQHFSTPKGEYDPAELGKQCQPLKAFYNGDATATQGGIFNIAARPLVSEAGWPMLDTWNASVPLWDTHKTGECTHWCSPSAYHVWLYLFNQLLRDRQIGNALPANATFEPL